ncbi:DNA translocase FtsK [Rosettibacter firmus]|uniref:DNA translocase FtsK n=1 Tax=Rosettibacter firmus TaxID=3111522 RepID=UPI00336BEB94
MSNKKSKSVNSDKEFFVISPKKKKKILGILFIVFALLIFLSILSYSRYDDAFFSYRFTDLFNIFFANPELKEKAANTHNWLGIFGAYISNFFIHATLGYFSLIFPVILFIWGYTILRSNDFKLAIYFTNFFLVIGILLSSFFGVLRNAKEFKLLKDYYELSGNVGDYIGIAFSNLMGGLGSIIFLSAGILITLIISFDVRFSPLLDFLKSFFEKEIKEKEELEEISDNTIKIKSVNAEVIYDDKELDNDAELDKQKKTETKIRIIKKDDETKIYEPEEFPAKHKKSEIQKVEKPKVEEELIKIDKEKEAELPDQWNEEIDYTPPSLDLLITPDDEEFKIHESELKRNAQLLKEKLSLFDIEIEDITVTPGPVVTLYEIVPAPGVKISRIVSLEHDIALALAARGIRIIAPIPGKSAIGVEIPNAEASLVRAKSVISKLKDTKAELPLALGKTISGEVYITDLAKMPHLLIAGSTGSGKSVGINMIIHSLIYSKHPSDVKFVIFDPKKIELSFYRKLSRHFLAVSPDLEEEIITTPTNALLALKAVEYEMEKRYDKLAKAGVRNIVDYNRKVLNPKTRPHDTEEIKHHKLPYIIVIIDELADLMMTSGKEVEEPIARLAQLARAVGIHLILATQRPSVNVITGVIKANFSARIAYQVATKIDSRTILDMNGAEQLLGSGDMLFLPAGMPKPIRIQNAFITTEEIERVTNFIYQQKGYSKRYFLPSIYEKKKAEMNNFLSDLDPMFEEAARIVVRHQQGSVSLLQRKLKLGYSRAARIIDQLEQAGIVGPAEGSKAREVIVENEEQLETILRSL